MDKWDKRFIDMAEVVGSWSSCYQENRQVGAVIVKDKHVLSTGYNGAPAGVKSCKEKCLDSRFLAKMRHFFPLKILQVL